MTFKYRPTPYVVFQQLLVRWELDEVKALIEHVEEHRGSREARLMELQKAVEPGDDRYVDDFHEVMRVSELASELAIVALHRVVEIHRARVLRIAYPEFSTRDLERFEVLKSLVLHTRQFDVSTLDGAADVNELRVLNNAVKHHAQVTEELARFSAWKGKVGEKLGDLSGSYVRLRDAVPRYLDHLARTLVPDE